MSDPKCRQSCITKTRCRRYDRPREGRSYPDFDRVLRSGFRGRCPWPRFVAQDSRPNRRVSDEREERPGCSGPRMDPRGSRTVHGPLRICEERHRSRHEVGDSPGTGASSLGDVRAGREIRKVSKLRTRRFKRRDDLPLLWSRATTAWVLTFPRYPRKRLRSSTAIRTRGGIPYLPGPVLRCDDPFGRCNRVDRHQLTTQFAHDSTGRDPRDDCSVPQPLRRWDVCMGRDRWRREGECLDGSSLEYVRVPACSFREPHGICNLRIGPVMANECDPFVETSRAASRAGTVVRLPIILRIRDQCASTTAKSAGAPLVGTRTSNRTCQGSRT